MNLINVSAWLHWMILVSIYLTTISLWYASRRVEDPFNIWISFWLFFALCLDRLASVYIALVVSEYGGIEILVDPWRIGRVIVSVLTMGTFIMYNYCLVGKAINKRLKGFFRRWVTSDEI